MKQILLLDVGWPQSGLLMGALRRVGFEILRATPGAFDSIGLGGLCRQIPAPPDFNSAYLAGLLAEHPNVDVVLPLTEEILAQLWQLPAEQLVRVFPHATETARTLLLDRRAMYRMAAAQGVPVPESVDLESTSSITTAAAQLRWPLVLRGTAGVGGKQVRIVDQLEIAQRELEDLRTVSPGMPFAQRMIGGRRFLFGALLHRGQVLSAYTQTTVEGVAPPTGPSIRVRTVDVPVLHDYGAKLFAQLEWSGLACAEFVEDTDGRFYFMEINPRPWAAITAAAAAGAPLIDQFVDYLSTGRTSFPPSPRLERDVPLFPQYLMSKALGASPWASRDIGPALRCLASSPWSEPRLLLHYLRTWWWLR